MVVPYDTSDADLDLAEAVVSLIFYTGAERFPQPSGCAAAVSAVVTKIPSLKPQVLRPVE